MSRVGTCETGCAEHKLVVVRSATLHELAEIESTITANTGRLREIAAALQETPKKDWQAAYEAIQQQARVALRAAPDDPATAAILGEPTEPAITWWCDRCEGVDAPQECLGICLWRPVDWTREDLYRELRARVIAKYAAELRLRDIARRVAHARPRPGQHERNWRALARDAADALKTAPKPDAGSALTQNG
jgi:hypothetical protein